jgi:hypothetical protein
MLLTLKALISSCQWPRTRGTCRYYGESLPYPVSHDTPPEHLKYHTTKQARANIRYFAESFGRASFHWGELDLRPQSTPWIMIGGSYAEIRAAFTRNGYPETIYAAYASSAPVHAQVYMGVYYDQVYRGMIANGYESCVKDIQAALKYIDDQLARNETSATIKQQGRPRRSGADLWKQVCRAVCIMAHLYASY